MNRIQSIWRRLCVHLCLPADTIANSEIPNSCQACHKHKDEDVNKLNEDLKKIQAAMDWGAKTKP